MMDRNWMALLGMLVLSGCTGLIGDPSELDPSRDPDGGEHRSGDAGASCGDGVSVGLSPVRRLTRFEYAQTVQDLLGVDPTDVVARLSGDERTGGFDSNRGAAPDEDRVYEYLDAAERLAEMAVATERASLVGCDLGTPSCVQSFVETFGERAFRRPLDVEHRDELVTLFEARQAEGGDDSALELLLTAILFSPSFLYHVEPVADSHSPELLDGWSMAARLSYFVWGTLPDDALVAAAAAGELATREGVEAQARRLLASTRAAPVIADFHSQWLGIDQIEQVAVDETAHPEWSRDLARAVLAETGSFVSTTILEGDGLLSTLLTASYTVASPEVAATYGLRAPAVDGRIDLTETPREGLGLFGHPSLLTEYSGATTILRGRFVRERFLCDSIPDPPADIDLSAVEGAARLTTAPCSHCHTLMEPIGYAFERFDGIGAFRVNDDSGMPIDVSGEIVGTSATAEVAGTFETPIELARRLAESEVVANCVARHWSEYAARRELTAEDQCALREIQGRFRDSGFDVRELLTAIAGSEAFRMRATAEEVSP